MIERVNLTSSNKRNVTDGMNIPSGVAPTSKSEKYIVKFTTIKGT